MSYSNEFLRNFRPVFLAILKAQSFRPERVELVVIDEEQSHVFEPADVRDVLEQILRCTPDAPHIFPHLQRECMRRTGWW